MTTSKTPIRLSRPAALLLGSMILSLLFASCDSKYDTSSPLDDPPTFSTGTCADEPITGPVSVDEASMLIEQSGEGTVVTVPLSSTFPQELSATIDLSLETTDGEVVATGSNSISISVEDSPMEVSIPLEGAPTGLAISETINYLLKYTLSHSRGETEGVRSMFSLIPQTQGILTGPTSLVPGAENSFRISTSDYNSGKAVEGASVTVRAGAEDPSEGLHLVLYQGTTDERGICEATFVAPNNLSDYTTIYTEIDDGSTVQLISSTLTVQDSAQILLTSDKPIYQPGQTIHLRALSLDKPYMTATVSQDLLFEVLDPKGNKVFKETVTTDTFGVASTVFQLASEVNMGAYTIRCGFDTYSVEKTVTVERYTLPKFGVTVTTDADFYQPGDTISGSIDAAYFFGMPLENASVTIDAKKYDVSYTTFATTTGQTDTEGILDFQITLPTYFVGQPLNDGNAFALLTITVEDTAGQSRTVEVSKPVVQTPVLLTLVPESGTVVPGLDNTFYLLTSSPTGTPIVTTSTVTVGSDTATVTSGADGIATFQLNAPSSGTLSVSVASQHSSGAAGSRTFSFSAGMDNSYLLLRTDQAVYDVGDAAQVTIHCPATAPGFQDRVYVDVIKDGRAVLMKTLDVVDGLAEMELPITQELTGGAAIEAYYISNNSLIIRDRKVFYVSPANGLHIAVDTDQSTYLPAEDAQITFTVTDDAGLPVTAAIGTQIVDEAIYSLMEFKPGLEKVFYSLEEDIMSPSYEIHGYGMDDLMNEEYSDPSGGSSVAQLLFAVASEGAAGSLSESFRQEQATALGRSQQMISAMMPVISAQLESLCNAGALGDNAAALEYLTENANCWRDPWGTAFLPSAYSGYFTMASPGPDEEWNSEDDVSGRFTLWCGDDTEPDWGSDSDTDTDTDSDSDCDGDTDTDGGGTTGDDVVRVRSYFPETLYVNPALITGADGTATATVTMADSITTWRLSALASTADGKLGSTESGITVFQDFFVDIDFPAALTQDDEIAVPIAIYNYLPEAQTVTLTVDDEAWFDLLDLSSKTVVVQPGEVVGESFLVRVNDVGWHNFTVYGYGSAMSDAVSRSVEVVPNGMEFVDNVSGRLESQVDYTVNIPASAIPDASKILVKVFPGMISHAVEGLDSMLSMPCGCFEQTSSSTYPNVLVLDYLISSGQITPEIEMTAREYINLGYQRLLTFESQGGGFEWFGGSPAHNILTAYGLLEFHDMSSVHPVDPAVITRTQAWLASQQASDGHWEPSYGGIPEGAINAYEDDVARTTAYLTYALAESGYSGSSTGQGIAWIKSNYSDFTDAYGLAIFANALISYNPADAMIAQALGDLDAMKVVDGDHVYWTGSGQSTTYGSGSVMSIETTALVAYAMMRAGMYPTSTQGAIDYLVSKKDSLGNWSTTQATVLTIRALLESISSATQPGPATIDIYAHGALEETLNITSADSDVMRIVDLGDVTDFGSNPISIQVTGDSSYTYQIISRHYLPWTDPSLAVAAGSLDIDVTYDTTALSVSDTVNVEVTVTNTAPGAVARMILVDLGLPPGFSLISDDLAADVSAGVLQKFETTNRQLILYVDHITNGTPLVLSYQLLAEYPVNASSGSSGVHPYYSPEDRSEIPPVELTVSQ